MQGSLWEESHATIYGQSGAGDRRRQWYWQGQCLRLAAEGGSVFCVDLNGDALASTVSEITAEGGIAAALGL